MIGCDVHPVIEVKDEIIGWMPVGFPPRDRCYMFFEALAGVRASGIGTPIFDPRGLPEDINYRTKDLLSGEHSQSYFTLKEAIAYDAAWLAKKAYTDSIWPYHQWLKWIYFMETMKRVFDIKKDKHVRVVFDFDS